MGAETARIHVECYAGYRGDEEPRAIQMNGRTVRVVAILDRWVAPDHRYFKVKAGGDVYVVRHDVRRQTWELTMFRRCDGHQGRS